eukprot:COSAG01_NODE_1206_length_11242_cov_29.405905_13_plen_79_part_00
MSRRGRRPPAILPRSERLARAAHKHLIASTKGCSSWAASALNMARFGGGRAVYTTKTVRAAPAGRWFLRIGAVCDTPP